MRVNMPRSYGQDPERRLYADPTGAWAGTTPARRACYQLGGPNYRSPTQMSFAATAALGAIAGFTIFLGLPVARAQGLSDRGRVALSMLSAGILAFLFMDVG